MDYVAARHVYAIGLVSQFLGLASQCLEKHLKAITLHHGGSVKSSHNLHSLFEGARQLLHGRRISFSYPAWLPDFLSATTEFGTDRYCLAEYYLIGYELVELDEAVWSLRRYGQAPPLVKGIIGDRAVALASDYFSRLAGKRPPDKCGPQGYLQRLLSSHAEHESEQRAALVTGNLCFGDGGPPMHLWSASALPFWKRGEGALIGTDPQAALNRFSERVYMSRDEKDAILAHYGLVERARRIPSVRKTRLELTPHDRWITE